MTTTGADFGRLVKRAAQEREHGAMVANIIATYSRATSDDVLQGRAWYAAGGAIVDALAEWSGVERTAVAATIAALSPRNPWRWNVADAAAYCDAAAHGRPRPGATTFGANQARAWGFATGTGESWTSAAPKVRSFVRNLTGDRASVTVDTWAMRVATNGRLSAVRPSQYASVAAAYTDAARMVGEDPRDLQAITWVVLRNEAGEAHARTFKVGTPAIVHALHAGGLI